MFVAVVVVNVVVVVVVVVVKPHERRTITHNWKRSIVERRYRVCTSRRHTCCIYLQKGIVPQNFNLLPFL